MYFPIMDFPKGEVKKQHKQFREFTSCNLHLHQNTENTNLRCAMMYLRNHP